MAGLKTGRYSEAEKINGRAAMLGVAATLLIELFSGKSVMHMFGL